MEDFLSVRNVIFETTSFTLMFFVLGTILERNNKIEKSISRKSIIETHVKESFVPLLIANAARLCINAFTLAYSPYSNYFDNRKFTLNWAITNSLFLFSMYETFFYFFHRALHSKYLYQKYHKYHHKQETTAFSTNTTSSLEIVGNVFLLHIPKLFIPFYEPFHHVLLIFVFVISSMGHDPYFDIFAHQKHHDKHNVNFSSFLPIWDVILGTRWKEIKT